MAENPEKLTRKEELEALELLCEMRSRERSLKTLAGRLKRGDAIIRKILAGDRAADRELLSALRRLTGRRPAPPLVRDLSRFAAGCQPRFGR